MGQYSIDVKSIKKGTPGANGTMAVALTEFGDIKENTLKVTEAEGTTTPIRAAGKSAPVINVVQDGDITIEFDLMTKDKEVVADFMGGEVVEGKWHRPVKKPTIFNSFEIEDGDGDPIQMPYVQISATIQNVYSPTDVNVIRVKGTVLQPKDAATSAIIW